SIQINLQVIIRLVSDPRIPQNGTHFSGPYRRIEALLVCLVRHDSDQQVRADQHQVHRGHWKGLPVQQSRQPELQDRVMLTGRHMVRDVFCKNCDTKVGWIYEFATEENQRYKEGRVILERALVTETDGIDEHVGRDD
ncbi:Hypothetical predicted protein, partial [Cloeon dipterum]